MDKVVNKGERVPILPGDGIQSLVVLDEVKLPIFLLDEEDWGSVRGRFGPILDLIPACRT
jgi:hypothetical protein